MSDKPKKSKSKAAPAEADTKTSEADAAAAKAAAKAEKKKRKAEAEASAATTAPPAAAGDDIGVPATSEDVKPRKSKKQKTDTAAAAPAAAAAADEPVKAKKSKSTKSTVEQVPSSVLSAQIAKMEADLAAASDAKAAKKAAKKPKASPRLTAASSPPPTRELRSASKSPKLAAAAAAAAMPALTIGKPAAASKPAKAAKSDAKSAAAPAASSSSASAAAGTAADGTEVVDVDSPDKAGNPPIKQFVQTPDILQILLERKITHMFPIQAACYPAVHSGKDVLGRARTGTGKTLAFALPIIEKLQNADALANGGKTNYRLPMRRAPRVIVLLPTRELALQVAKEFELVAKRLSTLCIYGGSAYGPQEAGIRAGLDVVVGTCGRVMDVLERKSLKLDKVEHIILDEADEMLNMGFADSVEAILQNVPRTPERHVQTLLFSATVPDWVNQISKKYFRPDFTKIDLVGNTTQQASTSVTHIAIPCHWSERKSVLADVVLVYGGTGPTIIFTETKKEANELATDSTIASECQALHGDIAQNQREITLRGFRERKFKILVATDVAARGLDIQGVDLVIQAEPPRDHETYIHRSGRTGRAGSKGVCVIFYTPKQLYELQQIERRAKVKFQYATIPTSKEIIRAGSKSALAQIESVDEQVLEYFNDQAKDLIASKGAEKALALALAVISGQTKAVNERSLLCSAAGFTTVCVTAKRAGEEIRSLSYVWTLIRKFLYPNGDESVDTKVKGMRFLKAKNGAVFDMPSADVKTALGADGKITNFSCTFEAVREKLPELVPIQATGPSGFGGGGFRGGKFGGGGRGGGGGGGRPRGGGGGSSRGRSQSSRR